MEPIRLRKPQGFSLVELLVVVTVIVILIALLTPALDRAMSHAERVRCAAIQHKLNAANLMYAQDARGWFVIIKENGPAASIVGDRIVGYNTWVWNALYRDLCGASMSSAIDIFWPPAYACPTDRVALGVTYKTMGFNWSGVQALVNNVNPNGDIDFSGWNGQLAIKRTRVATPSYTAQMSDTNDWHTQGDAGANYAARWDTNPYATNSQSPGMVAYRHEEGLNIQHFDGSTRYYRKPDAYFYLPDGAIDAERNKRLWRIYR